MMAVAAVSHLVFVGFFVRFPVAAVAVVRGDKQSPALGLAAVAALVAQVAFVIAEEVAAAASSRPPFEGQASLYMCE
jgi:hypothetical protein